MPTGINTAAITPYSTGIINVINGMLVPALMAIAFIVFLWGVYNYFILGAADEKSRTDGRQFTLWGVVGFVVILSLWGLVNLVMGTLGLTVAGAPPPPTIWGSTTGNNYNPGNSNNSGTQYNSSGTGATVYNSDGSVYGNVQGTNIVNSIGAVIGRVVNGQAVTNSGTPISGAEVVGGGVVADACPQGGPQGSYCMLSGGGAGTCQYWAALGPGTCEAAATVTAECTSSNSGSTCTTSGGSAGTCTTDDMGIPICQAAAAATDVPGCTNSNAYNYNSSATTNDGSCMCTDGMNDWSC